MRCAGLLDVAERPQLLPRLRGQLDALLLDAQTAAELRGCGQVRLDQMAAALDAFRALLRSRRSLGRVRAEPEQLLVTASEPAHVLHAVEDRGDPGLVVDGA